MGLPPERGGRSKHSGGLPATKIECNAGVKGDKCVFDPSRRILIIEHSKPRQPLFDPKNDPKIPISIRCLGSARTSIMIVKGKVDFIQDNWRKRGEYPIQNEWVGITCFRVYGPYETDLGINICHIPVPGWAQTARRSEVAFAGSANTLPVAQVRAHLAFGLRTQTCEARSKH